MARLHEFQGKALLRQMGIAVPKGAVVTTPEAAADDVATIDGEAVLKAQAWTTARFKQGLIRFATTAADATEITRELLARQVSGYPVTHVLVEEKIDIAEEYFASLIISDTESAPVLIFSAVGGSGVEEIVREHPDKVAYFTIDVRNGIRDFEARNLVRRTGIHGKAQLAIAGILVKLWQTARKFEARSLEINPLVKTRDGRFLAADCRVTIDDYAVYRHPELGIEIARELNHPPTELEKIAYKIEKDDYRGTFYFIQMATHFEKTERYIGFHGAGGGGSMMGMDALQRNGYRVANFCDTSGNPPASKVYRAAKIILSQKNIAGYFGSGSGVASQEQFHSARGLVKAFREAWLAIPAVIRLGGNSEDLAVKILTEYTRDLPAPVEGYKKDDPVEFCVERLDALIRESHIAPPPRPVPLPPSPNTYSFQTPTGDITFDHDACLNCETHICVETCVPQILKLDNGKPVLNISRDDARNGKCIECLACEVECHFRGNKGGRINLPIEGLDDRKGGANGNPD